LNDSQSVHSSFVQSGSCLFEQQVEVLVRLAEISTQVLTLCCLQVQAKHDIVIGAPSIPAEEALLEARILNVRPPYANFYRAALGAVDRASEKLNQGRGFVQLSEAEQRSFVDQMRQGKLEAWQGPPGPFVYLLLRSDAVDVVYGTMDGYAALGIPYKAHIAPAERW